MPLPGNVSTGTVTGRFVDGTGAPLKGSVRFTPSDRLLDASGNAVLGTSIVEVTLDATGSFSVALAATDNLSLNPTLWYWVCAPRIYGAGVDTFNFRLASFTTVDLSAIAPLITSSTGTPVVVGPQGPKGYIYDAFDIFAEHADGVLVGAPKVGPVYAPYSLGGAPTIVGGKLTSPATGSATSASYAQVNLGVDVVHIGAAWTFTAGSTTSTGTARLVIWDHDYASTPAAVPDSTVHLSVGKDSWDYGRWLGGVYTSLASGTFTTQLANDGASVLTCQVTLDRGAGKAYVILPTGRSVIVTDSSLNVGGGVKTFAGWGTFRTATATDTRADFTRVWADATLRSTVAQSNAIAMSGIVRVSHGTDATVARPTGASVVYWLGTARPNNALAYDLWYNA